MPTNRRYRTRVRHAPIDPVHWAILTDAPLPADANPFLAMDRNFEPALRPLWKIQGPAILIDWIAAHPGTRPACWWLYDAPRAGSTIDPRQCLFGEGRPLHEVLNVAPSYAYGIPVWCGDPDAPPIFETQHAYLKRHGLLEPGERKPRSEPHPFPARIEPTQ